MSNYKRDNKGYLKRGTCSTFRFEENTANSIVLKTVQFLQNLTPNLPEQINFQVVKFHDLDSFYLNQIISQSEMYFDSSVLLLNEGVQFFFHDICHYFVYITDFIKLYKRII